MVLAQSNSFPAFQMYAPRVASYTQYNDEFYPWLTETKEKLHEVEIQCGRFESDKKLKYNMACNIN